MSKNAGYLVETKSGKRGRTYHHEGLVNKKMVVHIENDEGKELKMLCDPKTVKIIGFAD
jgi:hypothetical protein